MRVKPPEGVAVTGAPVRQALLGRVVVDETLLRRTTLEEAPKLLQVATSENLAS
jgi:hypothetical protein